MKRRVFRLLVAMTLVFVTGGAAAAEKPRKKAAKPAAAAAAPKEKLEYDESGRDESVREEREREEHQALRAKPMPRERKQRGDTPSLPTGRKPEKAGPPVERQLTKASSRVIDLRRLPVRKPKEKERPEHELEPNPVLAAPGSGLPTATNALPKQIAMAAAPAPLLTFDGLDRFNWGAGSPPDTTGDVGPNYFIQAVNTSVGIYRKSDGFREAAFTFDTLMSQGNFGNQCDNENFGDPVILYDTFEDRWVLTDFAFTLDGGNNVNPPEAFQCFAVSMNGDPLTGGWNFYYVRLTDGLNDYEKLGIWPDGIYMSANMFGYPASASFQGARVWAFNKHQMYAGSPTVKVVSFDIGTEDFTAVPANARLQTGTPPLGRPAFFMSSWNYLNALTVYKFHVDWNNIPLSTFTGPDIPIAATSWPNASPASVPQAGTGNLLDSLAVRAMVQNTYTNFGGVESLWLPHTVRRANTAGFAAPRWYQVDISGGNVNLNIPQAATWDPDGANVLHRWMPSLALDRTGNLAMGYSTSSAGAFPSIAYAGRLAGDPVNTFTQTEQVLFTGTASQTTSTRWGDYSGMTLDPDGCTFWYTNEYANPASQASNMRWLTRIGAFRYPSCTMVGAGGTMSGTVTVNPGGAPLSGATVNLGARTATTNDAGQYSFTSIPAGTYPFITASYPGYGSATANSIVANDGLTTVQNLQLTAAPVTACLVNTTQADFQSGFPTNVDLDVSPGDVKLANSPTIDAQNKSLLNAGFAFTTDWHGQTFTALSTGPLVRLDLNLFSLNCTTMPNVTVSIRTASANLPGNGADLATVTIPGFCNGASGYNTLIFGTPTTITAGMQYSIVWRTTLTGAAVSPNPRYVSTISSGNPYAGGQGASSVDGGNTWTGRTAANNDYGFVVFVDTGYVAAGNQISSVKDAIPAIGFSPVWSSLAWTNVLPGGTNVQFQAAGSNNPNGTFAFVGPDGTAATFFTTSGASLAQFNGSRFLQYKAYLSTASGSSTPSLNDVTVCKDTAACAGGTPSITVPPSVCSGATGNAASGPAGMLSYSWSITNGTITSAVNAQSITFTAGASGSAGLQLIVTEANGCVKQGTASVTITPILATPTASNGGPFCETQTIQLSTPAVAGATYTWTGPGGFTSAVQNPTRANATLADAGLYSVTVTAGGCTSPAGSTTVVVNPGPATPTASNGGPYCETQTIQLNTPAVGGATYAWTGPNGFTSALQNPARTNATPADGGTYFVTVTVTGCTSAAGSTTVVVNATPATPAPTNTGLYCDSGAGVTVQLNTATVGGATYAWTGPNGFTSALQNPTRTAATPADSGSYSVTVTVNGCTSAAGSTTVGIFTTPATPTITPGGPTTFCAGGSVTLTSSAVGGNQWQLNGNPIGGATNDTYVATATGTYTVVVTLSGCASPASAGTSVTVIPIPATPTITPGGPTTFCTGGSVTLTSSSASGNQWYLNTNPIGGETNNTYVATASGNYTLAVTASGCTSAPSAATTVTINPIPATPTITPGGPTTFCAGGSVTLTSSSAGGNQWSLNGNPIGGATNNTYAATASGAYTVTVTTSGCSSAASPATNVTVDPAPPTPTITPGGATTFCVGGSVTLTSSSASGNQWRLNGNPIGGATNNTYAATASGSYTVTVTASGCTSAASAATAVTVNPIPATPTITPGGPTTFCAGGSVTLTSSSASGNQWSLNGNPIGGATNNTYAATASGNYTVTVTTSGCSSAPSAATSVTVNPIPATPTITPGGPTTFCAGGSVTLTSSSAGGNQWRLNGNPIGGATNSTYVASVAGDYSVTATATGCTSAPSATSTVTVNPNPNAAITAAASVVAGSTGNLASVANAGAGATYTWSITNGTITAGSGTASITFTAGAAGTLNLQVTVTTSAGCVDTKSANVNVTAAPIPVTITTVVPPAGKTTGGKDVTINGTGFLAGVTVTFGGSAATNVVLVNSTKITAKTPAHAAGFVNVTVTNTNASTATKTNGYHYVPNQFDANGDNLIDPSDIFYLVNYIFLGGNAPAGESGMASGDANNDGVVDAADIFYIVNYLFMNGSAPASDRPRVATQSVVKFAGGIALGEPFRREERWVVPVTLSAVEGSEVPQALALRLVLGDSVRGAAVHRAGVVAGVDPAFEISRPSPNAFTYLLSFDLLKGGIAFPAGKHAAVVAEIEIESSAANFSVAIDPALTMLSNQEGTRTATVAAGTLRLSNSATRQQPAQPTPAKKVKS